MSDLDDSMITEDKIFVSFLNLRTPKSEKINPSLEIIELAEKTLKSLPTTPLYARVDFIFNNLNSPVISELELIEPELWFRFKPDSANKLALIIKDFLNNLNT